MEEYVAEQRSSGGSTEIPQIPYATKKRVKAQIFESKPQSDASSSLRALIHSKFKKNVRVPNALPPLKFTAAPMVGKSDLAFRMLCRRYGAQMAYTPMYEAKRFVEDPSYRAQFQTTANDRPLAVQFCANDPDTLLAAARLVESQCDVVDINLGCPQRRAHAGHYGAFLLDEPDHGLVFGMVRKLSQNLSILVSCKIRLLPTPEATLKFCLGLQEAGCAFIAVHARYRGSPTQPRDGPAHLDQLAGLKQGISIPVLANGNTRTFEDVVANLRLTHCDGVMVGEGLLDNPALFAASVGSEGVPEGPELALEYLRLCRQFGVPSVEWVRGNVHRMCRPLLFRFQLQHDLEQANSLTQVELLVKTMIQYRNNPLDYRPDPAKSQAMQTALSSQKQAKRQARQDIFRQNKIARRAAERVAKSLSIAT
jgi:tRNA-dihydrouridine synthase 1